MLDSEMDPEAGTALIKRVRLFLGCLGVFGEFGIPRSLHKGEAPGQGGQARGDHWKIRASSRTNYIGGRV